MQHFWLEAEFMKYWQADMLLLRRAEGEESLLLFSKGGKISHIQSRTYECIIPLGYLQINWKFAYGSSINKPFKVKCLYKTVLLGLVGCHEQFLALFSSLNQSFNNNDDWWQSFQHLNMKYLKCLNKKARGLWTKIHVYLMYMSQKWFRQNRILCEPHYTI